MNPKDSNEYGPQSGDMERDMGAKGGPTTSTGIPDDKHGISKPFEEDVQAQKAAKNKKMKKDKKEHHDL
jgi:hypothetical protein